MHNVLFSFVFDNSLWQMLPYVNFICFIHCCQLIILFCLVLFLAGCHFTTMTLSGQHVLGFSPNGKYFALINDQGILRIWNTNTNELRQEYTPNLHLSAPCSALLWILASNSAAELEKKSKKKKKTKEAKQSYYIALGTSKGQVSLYSFAEAKVVGIILSLIF